MTKYRVNLCREFWGYIDVEASSESEAIEKVENYEYADNEEFKTTKIGEQSVYSAEKL